MARIFRQTFTKSIPENAQILTRKGRRVARFRDGNGKTVTAPVSKDGRKVILETAKWYIDYKDADGRPKRRAGYTDRQATEQLAGELERTAEHVRSGYKPKEHEHLARPLLDHLAEFRESLLNKGTSARQAKLVHVRVKKIIAGCRFTTWSDISASKVQRFLAEKRKDRKDKDGEKIKRGLSAQTSNFYLQAIKQFCSWLVREGRAPESPVAHLQGLNVKTDRRHDRRALTEDECRGLISAAASGPVVWGMAGSDRAMLYRAALETGLRAGELGTLTVGACGLDESPPVLIVKAGYSKHRREDEQPIKRELAEAMAEYTAGRAADEHVFPNMPGSDDTAKMFRRDVEAAEIPYRDGADRVADFHSLRHTYITNLARAGVHPKEAMDLARHSDINLTMARYSHTVLADRAEALERLPSFTDKPGGQEQRKATGTCDDKPRDEPPKGQTTSRATSKGRNARKPTSQKRLQKPKDGFLNRRSEVRVLSGVVGSGR